jgi:hypothetical protein
MMAAMTVSSSAPLPAVAPRPGDEVVIHYNPRPATARLAAAAAAVHRRLLWLGLAAFMCLMIWVAQRSQLDRGTTIALFAAGVGYSLLWLVWALIAQVRARRVLRGIGQGIALRIGRWGIDIHGATLPWSAVTAVRAVRRPGSSFGPDLVVEDASGAARALPWLYLDALPGAVDSAVQAYTAGARCLDVSKLDH